MSRYQVAYKASTKEATIQAYGDDSISGTENIGDFYHDGGGVDKVGDDSDTHVLFHHVQDLLYTVKGEQNMQSIKILRKRVTSIDATAADTALNLTTDTSEQITTTFVPTDAANRGLIYTSSDPTKLTVNETGLVTAIAVGTATITVTSVDTGVTDTVAFTVA